MKVLFTRCQQSQNGGNFLSQQFWKKNFECRKHKLSHWTEKTKSKLISEGWQSFLLRSIVVLFYYVFCFPFFMNLYQKPTPFALSGFSCPEHHYPWSSLHYCTDEFCISIDSESVNVVQNLILVMMILFQEKFKYLFRLKFFCGFYLQSWYFFLFYVAYDCEFF